MNKKELLELIVTRFRELPEIEGLIDETVEIRAKALSPEEAIGNTERKDYPILDGKDVMIEAVCNGASGQAFTCAPADFSGTLNDVLDMDFENDPQAAGLMIAAINAVMASLGICDRTVHCKNEGPALCGIEMMKYFKENHYDENILIVGYQPSIISNLTANMKNVRVLDLNPDNIGYEKCGAIIEDGERAMKGAVEWADVILCTGSTVCNGTLVDYLDTGKKTYFFGTPLAGTAKLLDLYRLCFADIV